MNPLALQLLGMSADPTADAVSDMLKAKSVEVRTDVAKKLSDLKTQGVDEKYLNWAINGGRIG